MLRNNNAVLWCFSFFVCLITYGFALTNFTLSVDSESFIFPNFSMDLGRWGNNLVRYHIFNGHIPYFTLLLGLCLLSFTAVIFAKLLRFSGSKAYMFCALFLSFPQLAYHLIFNMQADSVPLGFLMTACSMLAYTKSAEAKFFSAKNTAYFIGSALLMMFSISMYQALVFVPIAIYLMRLLQETDFDTFDIKQKFFQALHFGGYLALSAVFYYLSVRILCPPIEQSYLSSYASGQSPDLWGNFYKVLSDNLSGKAYYGEQLYFLMPLLVAALAIGALIRKRFFIYKLLILALLLVLPFLIAFFISNGYYPPRIYLTSGMVLAFLIVYAIRKQQTENTALAWCAIFALANIYFVTQLFYSANRIFNSDKETARKIDMTIQMQYPDFDPKMQYIYFHGGLPFEQHEPMRLPNSEIFGGSLLNWDNGSNDRIINFFKFTGIAHYKMIDNKDVYLKIKDSIEPMAIWPKKGSVKMIDSVMVVRLGKEKGAKLWVE